MIICFMKEFLFLLAVLQIVSTRNVISFRDGTKRHSKLKEKISFKKTTNIRKGRKKLHLDNF